MAPAPWTNEQIIAQIDSGYHWSSYSITFGFPTSSPYWAIAAEGDGFSSFNAAQQEAARMAMAAWDDVANIDLIPVSPGANPTITLQNTTTDIAYAHAYYPGAWSGAGSVWTNPRYASLTHPDLGSYGFMAIMHEIGHTLGLAHPGPYNGGSPTYGNDALYQQDTHQYTVMSYFDASNTGADWRAGDGVWRYPQTPMLDDILVLQAIYGPDTQTRSGNTVYGFHANADRTAFDFTLNPHPIVTIWDAGGNDIIDLSGFSSNSNLNLRPGTYSDADNMTHNIAIAYGALIENGVGGSGDDTLGGNWQANKLWGHGGHDVMYGRSGKDTLAGGDQGDRLFGGPGQDRLVGDKGYDQLFGGRGNDQLIGGRGQDRLSGGSGDDRLNGGRWHDYLTGGPGHDTFVFSSPAQSKGDRITDFTHGTDSIDLAPIDADSQTGGNQAFSFIAGHAFSGHAGELRVFTHAGHTVVSGDVNGDGSGDFWINLDGIVTVTAGDFIL